MNVLITGGYGFIGSHVADVFHKHGDKIFIIDNLTTGNIKNLNVKHKLYKMNVEDSNCEEIFKNNNFDLVIHLASNSTKALSLNISSDDMKSNLLGLINILDLSTKYGVKKVIIASSAEVYGNNLNVPISESEELNPISSLGINMQMHELYCKKWTQLYGLKTVILRLSNVYGPRQATLKQAGTVSTFIGSAFSNDTLNIYGDAEITRDFIYVEDVAYSIYLAALTEVNEALNVSTNSENSLTDFANQISTLIPIKGVEYHDMTKNEDTHGRLDNSKIKEILNWSPKYTLEEGVDKTFKWYQENHSTFEKTPTLKPIVEKKPNKIFNKRLIPYIENILIFALLFLFNNNLSRSSSDVFNINFDYNILYIIIMGILYGTRQSIIAVFFSIFLYLSNYFYAGGDLISFMLEDRSLIHICFYLVIGVIIGYTVDKKDRQVYSSSLKLENLNEKYAFLESVYIETRTLKDSYVKQIINAEDNFGKILEITSKLDSLQLNDIFNVAHEVIEEIMGAEMVSLYILSKKASYLRLKSRTENKDIQLPLSIHVLELKEVMDKINNNEIYINRKFTEGLPVMASAVMDGDRVVAIINIHTYDFQKLTLYYENLFKVTVNLISDSLKKAYIYEEATYSENYMDDTLILNSNKFKQTLNKSIQLMNENGIPFTLIKIINSEDYMASYNKIVNYMRDMDYIGIDKDNVLHIILSNLDQQNSEIVLHRLNKNGIDTEVTNDFYELI